MSKRAWYMRTNVCEVCGRRGPTQRHHVIDEADVRRAGGDAWDVRNRLVCCVHPCHARHSNAFQRIPLAKLRDETFAFAVETLGQGRAFNYLTRFYGGSDPRLESLIGAGRPDV